ncbi:hypothetical protein, conserved [Leishmania shawi]|uniref:200 kDa antigen p200 n=1 Tax=Leishmania shawi TaxID=5680 RepID=A0ABR3ECB9_9TRYP
MVPTTTQEACGGHFPHPVADGTLARSVPLPLLVEQQRDRIRALVQERDTAAAELSELHTLFQHLQGDYEEATRETDGLRLQLSSLRMQHEMQNDEHQLLRASHAHQQQRIQEFELEWASNSKHLREQLDTLVSERDAMQAQRDACMADCTDLRRQLIQLQAEIHSEESRHREALREQAETHAQQLRSALREKEEQLQARAAATRHEARLVQQELDQLGAGQTAAHEERESMRWRLSELEVVVTKKEQLRAELERTVGALRLRLADQEEAARQDAQRYAQRVQDLEQLYRGQVSQEQHRARTLQDDLAASRKAVQEALRQQEVLQQSHSERTRELTTRASKLEDDLRQQLRALRAELEEARARALQHEATTRRIQRDTETLQATCSSEQEARERLQQAHTAQAQQLLRAEGSVHILQARLREKEREAELLRCAMEQATWTREMRQAARHTLASLLGVPRVSVCGSRHRRKGEVAAEGDEEEREGWSPALQLEWAAEAQGSAPSPSSRKGQHTGHTATTDEGDTTYAVPEGGESVPSASEAEGAASSTFRSAVRVKRAQPAPDNTSSSLQRPPATPTQATTEQHVETIERTVQRGTGQSDGEGHAGPSAEGGHLLQPPLSFRAGFPLTATPPLHPGTPRAAGGSSPWRAQGSAGNAASAYSTAAVFRGAGGDTSTFSSPLRVPSFIQGHTTAGVGVAAATGGENPLRTPTGATRAQLLSTPLPSRQQVGHVYNISDEEEQRHQLQAVISGGTASPGPYATELTRGCSLTQRPRWASPLARQRGEVFFDDVVRAPRAQSFLAKMLNRGADAGGVAVAAVSHPRRAVSAQLTATSTAQVRAFNTYLTPSTYRGSFVSSDRVSGTGNTRGAQPSSSLGDSLTYDNGASAPGARAAELIAQLSHPSSGASFGAAAASDKSPVMERRALNINRHRNVLHSGDAALQQYLRDTVQQVLAAHEHEGTPQREPHHVARQRLDGSSSVPAAYGCHGDGVSSVGEVDEDDFGSASLLRSSVAVPLVRPTPQPVSTVSFVNGGGATRMVGPGDSSRSDARRHDSEREQCGADGVASATRRGRLTTSTLPTTPSALSTATSTQTRLRDGGIAHTLEQLASRQQQLLHSLGHRPHAIVPAAHSATVSSPSPWQATAADPHLNEDLQSGASITVPRSLFPQERGCYTQHQGQHEPEESRGVVRSSVGVSAAGEVPADAADSVLTVSARLPNTDSAHFGRSVVAEGHPAASARCVKESDVSADVELDPRQLSYSTTATTAQLTDAQKEGQSAARKGMSDSTAVAQGAQPGTEGQDRWLAGSALTVGVVVTTTASARSAPSVSEVSSLSQLERRFAAPF